MPDEPSTAPPVDELFDTLELERSRSRLVPLAVACAIASLIVVFIAHAILSGNSYRTDAVAIALIAGVFVGLAQAPVLAWAIARKKLVLVVPLIYILSTIATAAVMGEDHPFWSIFAFTLIVPLLAVLARLLPNRRIAVRNHCYACRYDLSGGTPGLCPECGAPQAVTAPPPMKVTAS